MKWLLIALLFVNGTLFAQTVEGTVISTSSVALPDAVVTLMKASGQNEITGYHTTTDASGNFQLQDVKDGVYTIRTQLHGYLSPNPGGPGNRPFTVENGVPTKHLRIEMMPGGKISGWVVDGRGSPVPGSKVVLAIPNSLRDEATTGTDGGFDFEQLPPGMYSLLAVAPLAWKPPDSVDGQEFAWLPTYLGGVSFPEGAARLVVRPGSDLAAQKLKLLAGPVHHLRGQVLDPAGNVAPGTKVELWEADHPGEARSTMSQADGSFEFAVTERQWRLSAAASQQIASLTVPMARKDLDVTLRLTMPFSVHGTIQFDPPDGGKMPAGILFTSENGAGMPSIGQVEEGGRFTAAGAYPGVYTITMSPAIPAPGYFLDTIRIGDREMLAREVEIVSGDTPISILFKAGGGDVQGSVKDCGAATVLLLPQDKAMRRQGLVRLTRCLDDDRFDIPSVRPGAYYIFAFDAGSSPLIPPYDLDQDYINQALKVTVENRSTTKIELKVIPPRWF